MSIDNNKYLVVWHTGGEIEMRIVYAANEEEAFLLEVALLE